MLLDNTENGFILKSNFELKKAYFLFKIISNRALTNIGKNALELSLKLKLPILFIVKGTGKHLAELSLEQKNKISHRALALKKLISYLNETR